MYLADSGRRKTATAASASGATPPSAKTLRHPKLGIIHAARKPPTDAPSGKPQNIALVTVERILTGQYSLMSVTAFGIAAPRPSPVKNRHVTSEFRCPAVAARRLNTPM